MKLLKILFCFIVVDFFFFSTTFSFSYGYNTKELLAVVGLIIYALDMRRKGTFTVTRELLGLLILSATISFFALFSAYYHNTQERTYTTYFLSMLVWLSAAFTVIRTIKAVHGKLSIELVSTYIIAVATVQGLIAVIADNYAPLDNILLTYIPGLSWSKSVDRLYGFGATATLDTGGIRFAIACVLCAHNIKSLVNVGQTKYIPLYVIAYLIITFTGNMIARTTSVGSAIALVYLLIYIFPFKTSIQKSVFSAWLWLLAGTVVSFFIIAALYSSDPKFHDRTRFAFEGFFSLIEEGHWHTGSNDKLKSMYVFPDNPETWFIGDGYFINPSYDANYMGEDTIGFYKDTDVGYLRFIFFFGLLGLTAYTVFILYAGSVCARLNPGNLLLSIVLTSMTFVIWFKVATDCFFILAVFICLGFVKSRMEPLPEEE